MSVWSDVLIGLAFVAGGYWLIKTIYQWNRFRRSIYIEIYSSYFEYAFRRKNLVRLSESFYLNNEFGKHKIFYQIAQDKNDLKDTNDYYLTIFGSVAQDKNEKTPQAYILILLPSGIYVLNVKNQSGKVVLKKHGDYKQYYTEKGKKGQADKQHEYLFKNPMDESRFFAKRIEQRIGATKIPVRSVIIFPEHAEITWDGTPENEIPIIHRKQLIQTLKEENEKNERVLSDDQIDELYHLLADESIELEKNS